MASPLLLLVLLGWTGISLWAAHRVGRVWLHQAAPDTASPGPRRLLQALVLAVLLPLPLLDELVAQSQFKVLCRDRLGVQARFDTLRLETQAAGGRPLTLPLRQDVSAPEPVGGISVAVARREHRYTDPATREVRVRFFTYEAQGGKLARITGHGAPLLFEGHCGPPVP